jgi:hypothetical protein
MHANYWLSGVAGHRVKHRPRPAAGVHLPHPGPGEGRDRRPRARSAHRRRGRGDRLLRRDPGQLGGGVTPSSALYGADPDRIEVVPPGRGARLLLPRPPGRCPPGARARAGRPPSCCSWAASSRSRASTVAVGALAELLARGHPDARLVVVGGPSGAEGAELARVRALADRSAWRHHIRLASPQPHHLLSTWYRAADVVLVPSRSESFGLVALEAAACGVPVVAAAVGGPAHAGGPRPHRAAGGAARSARRSPTAVRAPAGRSPPGRSLWAPPPPRRARATRGPRPPPGSVGSTPTSRAARASTAPPEPRAVATRRAELDLEAAIDAWARARTRREPDPGRGRARPSPGYGAGTPAPRRRGEGRHHRVAHPRPAHGVSTRPT